MATPDPSLLQSLNPQDIIILNLDKRLQDVVRSVETLDRSVTQFRDELHDEIQDLRRELREVRTSRWDLEEKQLRDSLTRREEETAQLKSQLKELETIRGSTNERIDRAVTQRLQEESRKRQDAARGVAKDFVLTGGRALAAIITIALAAALLIFLAPFMRSFFDILLAALGAK